METGNIAGNTRRFMKMKKLSVSALSSRMGMGSATLSNILNGKSEPKSSTLLKLADALGVSLVDLLSESPALNNVRFRSCKLSAREKAERDQTIISTAQWLEDYNYLEKELDEKKDYSLDNLADHNGRDGKKSLAEKVRKAFRINDPKEPVYDFVNSIENAGIKLRIYNFGYKKSFGLSVGKDEKGPAIIINSHPEISVERQLFTIAHELGHLLMHQNTYGSATGNAREDENQEKEADEFAGHLLLPDEGLRREWNESGGLHWVDAVLRIKKIYKVSYITVLKRLAQLDNNLDYGDLIKNFAVYYKRLHNHDLKNHYEPDALSRNDLVEDRFSRLVREAYEKEIISLSRAAEILGVSMDSMRELLVSWKEMPVEFRS
ncbi:MAG: ImmA/IrrE family metallo-endopeptidase [Spirochaetales bacterium]|nr:ImmA/IrrE family metallo-endopeptidase [Spirochaetales bacterium]